MKIKDIQETPNPNARKFIVDTMLTPPYESKDYESSDDIDNKKGLAYKILEIDATESILIHGKWLTVRFSSKKKANDRALLKEIGKIIRSEPIANFEEDGSDEEEADDPTLILINDVLTKNILPYLRSHGGSAEVVDFRPDTNKVFIRYKGACGGCPISKTSTLNAIEKTLQKEVDPNLDVELV